MTQDSGYEARKRLTLQALAQIKAATAWSKDQIDHAQRAQGRAQHTRIVLHHQRLHRRAGDGPRLERLAREHEVLELAAEGLPNREIAAALSISEHTVKFHLASVFGKLGVSTRAEAVRRGIRLGVIDI